MQRIAKPPVSDMPARRLVTAALMLMMLPAAAQNSITHGPSAYVEPDQRTIREPQLPALDAAPAAAIDGSGHHPEHPRMGIAGSVVARMMPADYPDDHAAMAGAHRLGPREISNIVHAQDQARPNPHRYSDMLWQWGQFLDHDLGLSEPNGESEQVDIPVPAGDPDFDPDGSGDAVIAFFRSPHVTRTGVQGPREQMNELTAWIDASQVYGSDEQRARALRRLDGSGQLKTSPGDLLPFNTGGLHNAGGSSKRLFLAGDIRANEQAALTAMHTLFVREHNRLAKHYAQQDSQLGEEDLFQRARRMVMAQIQVITYEEFLPLLLGADALPPYRGLQPDAEGALFNEFSTAAFRLGHTLLSPILLRLDASGNEIEAGHLSLADAFFSPSVLIDEGGIEPLLRGLSSQVCQQVDIYVVDEVRNFLFGLPGSGGMDLVSLNIQRGRDHGLPSYNQARIAMGRSAATDFADISSDPVVQERLASAYDSPDDVDLWTGGLAEDHVPGAIVGPLFHHILVAQFTALRDADRYWYQRVLTPRERMQIRDTRLADIIRRNSAIGAELQDAVFIVPGEDQQP